MPSYTAGGTLREPFGKNEFLASTKDVKTVPWTFASTGIPAVTVDGDSVKILQPGMVVAKITGAGATQGMIGVFDTGATDGRQTAANIVGINSTFLPWQLLERDVEVAVVYEAAVRQAWCFEYTAGAKVALTNATRDLIIPLAGIELTFR